MLDLPNQVVHGLLAPAQIEMRGLDDEQRRGRVMEEEVVVGLPDFGEVILTREGDLNLRSLGALAPQPLQHVDRRLEKDDEVGQRKIARHQLVEPLIDEQLVVVEIGERVDAIALEDEVANRRLAEKISLAQLLKPALPGEREEQLRLKCGAAAAAVELREKRVLGIVLHYRGVQSRSESLGEECFAETRRPFDRQIAKVHAGKRYHTQVRIASVGLTLVRLPLVRSFETSFGRMDAREAILVDVHDASGAVGWGECVADAGPFYSAEDSTTAWHVLEKYLVPEVLGRDIGAAAVSAAFHRVRGHQMAKAALEMAAWDLDARLAGQPLCERLGARARPIESGVSIGIQESVQSLVDRVAEERASGYRRIKIKIKPGWDRAPVEALRQAHGDIPLMVDANAAYSPRDTERLRELDPFNLMMIEQPLDYDDLVQHAELQKQLRTPVCLDESIHSPQVAVDAIDIGACRNINIKPGRLGGYAPSLAVHDAALKRGIPLWHGGMLETGIGRAHNLHLSTLPGFTLPGDVAASRRYFVPDLIEPPIEVRPDGTIQVPPGPGIGVVPEMDRVRKATVRSQRYSA